MPDTFDIAVVGATGVVGEALLEILSSRNFPVGKVYALASERSMGKKVDFGFEQLDVEDLADIRFFEGPDRPVLGGRVDISRICAESRGGWVCRHRQHLAVSI